MGRHHRWGWTTTAATLAIAALAVISALVLAAALAAVIRLVTATRALRAAWTWARPVIAAARGERVIGYAAGTAWLRHRARHGIAWGRALARLLATSLAGLRCALAWLWCGRLGPRLRSLCARLRCGSLCPGLGRSGLRPWLRSICLGSALSSTLGRLFVLLLLGGLIATGLCFIMSSHLLNHRRFDGGRSSLYKLTLFFQGGEQFLAGYSELLC